MSDLQPLIRSQLPRRPSRVLLIDLAEADPAIAEAHRVEHLDDLYSISSTTCSTAYDAIFCHARQPLTRQELRILRERLAKGGRLALLIDREVMTDRRQMVVDLAELGFVITAEVDGEPGYGGIFARRDPFVIRSYRDGDETGISRLFTPSFHVARSADHWRWKYLQHPDGRLRISLAISPEGEVVGQYAAYPARFWRRQRRTILACLQIGDLMTHPSFRHVGRGPTSLFSRCTRHFYASHCEGRVAFNYGFNTATSRAFSLRFAGAVEVAPVSYWRADTADLCPPRHDAYRIEILQRPGRELDRFFRRVASAYHDLFVRDVRYLNWRYFSRPDVAYIFLTARRWGRLVGWSVFRKQEDRLLWGDALFDPYHEEAVPTLLATALEHPDLVGASLVEGWFSPQPAFWKDILSSSGLSMTPEPNDLSLLCVPHLVPRAAAMLRQSYYTMGDGDLF